MPFRFGRALVFAVIIWLIGFVWGSIVFMTPVLKNETPIPYVSSNPFISFPILLIWLIVTYFMAKSFLKASENKAAEGLKLGVLLALVNMALDLLVLVILLKAGFGYFISLSVWFGYTMLLVLPWLVGRSLRNQTA